MRVPTCFRIRLSHCHSFYIPEFKKSRLKCYGSPQTSPDTRQTEETGWFMTSWVVNLHYLFFVGRGAIVQWFVEHNVDDYESCLLEKTIYLKYEKVLYFHLSFQYK